MLRFVRPGQVQQWHLDNRLQGQVVLISAEALAPSIARAGIDMKLLALDEWPPVATLTRDLFSEAVTDISRMRADIERFEGSEVEAAILRHTLLALLLSGWCAKCEQATRGPVRRARPRSTGSSPRNWKRGFHKRMSVLDYAKRLGYSESTLSRACVATVGRTAKDAIDLRIALEAKRLLVHSPGHRVAQIGHQLGFGEATNFVKFFRRMEGVTPLEFRRRALGT